MKKALAKNS